MNRKKVLSMILLLMIGGAGGIGYYYWHEGTNFVKSEDARLTGDIYRVMPRIAGKITTFRVAEGDTVVADQIMGQQDSSNLSTSMLDNSTLRAPIGGTVIKTLVKEGEVGSPGQPVALVMDKSKLYITANIEETELQRIKMGVKVDVKVDSFPDTPITGKVSEIGEATTSTFSLLPAVNTSGNFTKVTQRIPIKIVLDDTKGLPLSSGMNVVIKIHANGN